MQPVKNLERNISEHLKSLASSNPSAIVGMIKKVNSTVIKNMNPLAKLSVLFNSCLLVYCVGTRIKVAENEGISYFRHCLRSSLV